MKIEPDLPRRGATVRLSSWIEVFAVLATIFMMPGCKTFSSTQADLDRERQQIVDGHVRWYGYGSDLGPLRINYLDPAYYAPGGFRSYGNRCSDEGR